MNQVDSGPMYIVVDKDQAYYQRVIDRPHAHQRFRPSSQYVLYHEFSDLICLTYKCKLLIVLIVNVGASGKKVFRTFLYHKYIAILHKTLFIERHKRFKT